MAHLCPMDEEIIPQKRYRSSSSFSSSSGEIDVIGLSTAYQMSKRTATVSQATAPAPSGLQPIKFRVEPNEDFPSPFDVVDTLTTTMPSLKFSAETNIKGEWILTPKDQLTQTYLATLTTIQGRQISLTALKPEDRSLRAFVKRYPVNMGLQPLTRLPFVTAATRCTIRRNGQTITTRTVKITVKGKIPTEVNLGIYGTFLVEPYVPQPLRCFICQRYGHHKDLCTAPPRCAVCAGQHATDGCLAILKQGGQVQACCPNCRQGHHVWNPKCPARSKEPTLQKNY